MIAAEWMLTQSTEDGKEMNFACDKYSIKGLEGECDRHSRALQKAADLED